MKIGFDVGGVICPKHNDTNDLDNVTLPNPKVLELMNEHSSQGHELFIISYCGKKRAFETLQWLRDNSIVPDLVPLEKVYFNGDDKRAKVVIAKAIGLDMFYDDSQDIIASLKNNVPDADKKKKKWVNLKGKIGDSEWKPLKTLVPNWETFIDDTGFGGTAVLWKN